MKSSKLVINFIAIYQKFVSPLLGSIFGGSCRFTPTCSEYSKQAIEKYGLIRGATMSIKRITKCHPFTKPGFDPVN